jgi:HAD superfamily hydrolase (TIGR01450 family)
VSDTVEVGFAGLSGSDGPLHAVFDLVLLDLDGVVYVGSSAVPGAAEALDVVRAAGMQVRFVTNNASRTPEVVADLLTRLKVPASPGEVVTSSQVAAAMLARRLAPGSPVLVIGGVGLRHALTAEGLVPVDSVDAGPVAVVQGFAPDLGWRNLAEASRAVRDGLFWMATNLDLTLPTAHGPAPGNGSLIRAVATAAGRGPDDVAGKPRPGAFVEAARQAGAARPLVVGDRLDTDLEGARAAQMPGLLVMTGVTDVSALLSAPAGRRPTYVGRDLWALLHVHPYAVATTVDGGVEGRCARARVRAEASSGRVVVRPLTGEDPLELLRAAAVAAWQAVDSGLGHQLDATAVIKALRAVEPGVAWAR